jgi:hypothetical protein
MSGGRLEKEIAWPSFPKSHESDSEVIEIIKEMALTHPDRMIAEKLNASGYRGKFCQQKFTAKSVNSLRRQRNIPRFPDMCAPDTSGPRGDGRYNTRDVARMLRRCPTYVGHLCKIGRLDAIRSGPTSPYWIKIDSPQFEELREAMQKRNNTHDSSCESMNSGSGR